MTLRARIIALTTGVATVVLILFAVPLAIALRQSSSDRVIRESQYVVQGVADYFSTSQRSLAQSKAYVERVNQRADTSISVLLADGTVLGESAPEAPDATQDSPRRGPHERDDLGQVGEPRVTRTEDGWVIDIGVSNYAGDAVVRGYISDSAVDQEIHERWAVIGAGALILIALSAGAAEVVSRRLVRPLQATADTAKTLANGDLTARAPISDAREIGEVAASLNVLADRITDLLASERETLADLSHRLRTPLTAIRLDLEAMPDSEQTRDLTRHVAVLDQTLTTIIQNARDPQARPDARNCDAREIAAERVAFWAPLAEDQGRAFTTDLGTQPVWVTTHAEDLSAALDALLENAIAHTPEGTELAVNLTVDSDQVHLDVVDHGPGIPPGAGLRGRSDRGSSGLGLDIARTCAESSGGSLEILRSGGVTTVRLVLHRGPNE